MFSMETPQYLINDIIKSTNNISGLKEKLFSNGIKTKEYPLDDLMIIYHNYSITVKSDLQRECRSLVLKMSTLEMVAYSCESPILNTDGFDYIKSHNELEIVSKCYEGSCLSLFYHNDKWYLASRKHLNTLDTEIISEKYNKMYNLFVDVVVSSGYKSFEDFTNNLDKNNSYYMVLIHHDNKHIINYTSIFNNEKYKKLVLISVKDKNMCDLVSKNDNTFLNENIFLPELETIDNFFLKEFNTEYNTTPDNEGIVINKWDGKMKKFRLIKLQYNNYIYQSLLSNSNYSSLYLYQIGRLNKSLDLIEVDIVFKLCSSEIIELFKLMWNFKTGIKIDNDIYQKLPKEYKYLMYKVRGIFYSNNKLLRVGNIYALLKKIPITYLVSLLKSRNNLDDILSNNDNIKKYNTTQQLDTYKKFIDKL
jgi:hypothetical protein